MGFIEEYQALDKPLKQQLKSVAPYFSRDAEIDELTDKLVRQLYKKGYIPFTQNRQLTKDEVKRLALYSVVYNFIGPRSLMCDRFFRDIYAYDKNSRIYFDKILSTGDHVKLLGGTLPEREVVMKYYQSAKKDTSYEMDLYHRIEIAGARLPWYSTNFKFWGEPVLIVEKLDCIDDPDRYDDPYEVGVQLLDFLRRIHPFMLHSDIKIQNILKRRLNHNVTFYYLIDYGGSTTQKQGNFYIRRCWTKMTASQPKIGGGTQLSSPKNDLIELLYALRQIQLKNKGKYIGNCQRGFRGRLKTYRERLIDVNDANITAQDYQDLIDILKG